MNLNIYQTRHAFVIRIYTVSVTSCTGPVILLLFANIQSGYYAHIDYACEK